VLSALAHPARRQILLTIHFCGGRVPAGQIAARFSHSWPTTSRHLRVLARAGLVRVEPSGRERVYRLERDRLAAVLGAWLRTFRTRSET